MLGLLMGLPTVYRYVVLFAVLLAAVTAFKFALWRAGEAGKKDGRAEIQAKWDAEKVVLQEAALVAQAKYRQQENDTAASLAAALKHYREALRREKLKSLDDLLDAGVRLSIPATCDSPGGGGAAETAIASAGTPVQVRAELSRPAAEFLDGEARRADEIVRTLNLCIDTLALERKK